MKDGGYNIGYKKCSCFWGTNPGSLLNELEKYISDFQNLKVLDLGCGEGKNAYHLANKGCKIDAFDISEYAINNAKKTCKDLLNINLEVQDVKALTIADDSCDIIIAYGLYHCFNNMNEIKQQIEKCLCALKKTGIFIVCAFNNRKQDLSAHSGFNPLLLEHVRYVNFFKDYNILFESDQDLFETHPHNNIPHMHSMTRLIIQK